MPVLPLVPLALLGAALVALALPVLVPLRLLASRLPRPLRAGARFVLLVAAYLATFECGAMLTAGSLRARRLHRPPTDGQHERSASENQLARCSEQFFKYGLPLAGLRLQCDRPPPAVPADRPVMVVARHAGFLNAQLLTHEVFCTLGRRVMAITKLAVQGAPGYGALTRGAIISSYRWNFHGRTCALRRMITMARTAGPGDALLLFPEGTNATAARRRRAIGRLYAENRADRAARYRAMCHVLPPEPSGVRATLAAAPGADVLFFGHTGLEDLLTPLVDLGYPHRPDGVLRTAWWHVPAEQIPRDRPGFEVWLDGWWQTLDDWTAAVRAEPVRRVSPVPDCLELPEAQLAVPGTAATPR